jgi:hypothetical protein
VPRMDLVEDVESTKQGRLIERMPRGRGRWAVSQVRRAPVDWRRADTFCCDWGRRAASILECAPVGYALAYGGIASDRHSDRQKHHQRVPSRSGQLRESTAVTLIFHGLQPAMGQPAMGQDLRVWGKETAAWVEGGGTPRPPLEQSGSRPDGGGGRHRPAALSPRNAPFIPTLGVPVIEALERWISGQPFIREIGLSFLKRFINVTGLGPTCGRRASGLQARAPEKSAR